MGLIERLEGRRLRDEARFDTFDVISRDDVPHDVKEHYREVRSRLSRIQIAFDNTLKELHELTGQLRVRERRERKLQHRLVYNQKTGIPNHYFMDRDVSRVLDETHTGGMDRTVYLLIISLDERYDIVKRSLSPTMSEWILYQTGERLRALLPSDGRIYHTRDTEFIMMLVDPFEKNYLSGFATKIIHAVEEQFQFPDYTVSLGCHIGAAVFPEHGSNKSMLLRNADLALALGQKEHHRFVEYNEEMTEEVVEKMELQNSIIRALEEQAMTEINKQFRLHFQPVVEMLDVDSATVRHRVVGAESLIRWDHPRRGVIPPARFIPVAEETGLIIPIGNWALYSASDQLHAWSQTALRDIYVSVNLSPRQFRDEYLLSNIERALNRNEIETSLLKLEVTEGLVMEDLEDSRAKLEAIHDMGITVSIDDFGSGYSSLNYLKLLPIDMIKLDRTFIEDILTNSSTQGIVRAVLSMALGLGIEVIAEGIETHDEAAFLYEQGCRLIQGFYFSEPLSAYDFQKRLQEDYGGA